MAADPAQSNSPCPGGADVQSGHTDSDVEGQELPTPAEVERSRQPKMAVLSNRHGMPLICSGSEKPGSSDDQGVQSVF